MGGSLILEKKDVRPHGTVERRYLRDPSAVGLANARSPARVLSLLKGHPAPKSLRWRDERISLEMWKSIF
jgi:hypothetical protein